MNCSAFLSARGMHYSGAAQSLTLLEQTPDQWLPQTREISLTSIFLMEWSKKQVSLPVFLQKYWAGIVQLSKMQGETYLEMPRAVQVWVWREKKITFIKSQGRLTTSQGNSLASQES